MDLWVRSQDKLVLSKVDKLIVNGYDIFNQDQVIGTYSTYERALEVLDEIQEILETRIVSQMVYEMPKE